jgi:hypothetical protein
LSRSPTYYLRDKLALDRVKRSKIAVDNVLPVG